MDQHMELTDQSQFQQIIKDTSKMQKEENQISQTERYGSQSTQERIMQAQQQCTAPEGKIEKNCGLYHTQQVSFNSSSNTTVGTNQTIDTNNASHADLDKKKTFFQRPMPIKSFKRAGSTNENFFIGSQEKLSTTGLANASKVNSALAHFGMNDKLSKSNPLDLLKNMQKDSMQFKQAQSQQQIQSQSQNTQQSSTSQQQSCGNIQLASSIILKQKRTFDYNKNLFSKQLTNEKQVAPNNDTSIENPGKRQNTEQGVGSNANSNSFLIEELPFKRKSLLLKTTQSCQQSSSSTSASTFNQINQSPQLQFQQTFYQQQSQQLNQLQNFVSPNKKSITLTNFHKLTSLEFKDPSPTNTKQQLDSSPKQQTQQSMQANSLQSQSQPKILTGSLQSFPNSSNTENPPKAFQRNLYSHTTLPSSSSSHSTIPQQISSPLYFAKGESSSKIGFRLSLRKTNSQNQAASFSSQQEYFQRNCQMLHQKQVDQQVQPQKSKEQSPQSTDQQQTKAFPFELPEQEDLSSSEDNGCESKDFSQNLNGKIKNEKSRTFYVSSNQNTNKVGNKISSFNDTENQNPLGTSFVNKQQQNQVKRKINEAMSRATYYSTNFEKQKLFEQQNEEEENNFRELCEVFSIM